MADEAAALLSPMRARVDSPACSGDTEGLFLDSAKTTDLVCPRLPLPESRLWGPTTLGPADLDPTLSPLWGRNGFDGVVQVKAACRGFFDPLVNPIKYPTSANNNKHFALAA